jgi:hypothetical protein
MRVRRPTGELITVATNQYATGNACQRIESTLREACKDLGNLTADDLVPLGHFHTLGLSVTRELAELARIKAQERVLGDFEKRRAGLEERFPFLRNPRSASGAMLSLREVSAESPAAASGQPDARHGHN